MILEELKRLKSALADSSSEIARLNKKCEELISQLADVQLSCRVKDRIIAEREVTIDDLKERIRDVEIMG